MESKVVIAGGGIGGIGAALMLARRGISVTVLERTSEFKEVGAGLQLAPNITRMLEEVGVLEELLPLCVQPSRLVFLNAESGEELTTVDLGDAKRRYGGPYVVLHRSDLLDALVAAACRQSEVTLLTGHQVVSVDQDEDGVVANCANGAKIRGSVLVGADGLHSVVRGEISQDEPICSGYVAYRGTAPIDEVDHRLGLDSVAVWMGPGLHLVQYPVRAGKLYNQVAVFRSQEYLDGQEDWGTPAELDNTYGDMAEGVTAAVPALGRQFRWPMYDREPLETWTKGRITLLGDAAHAMLQYLAQGAGQSLLDGAALAEALSGLAEESIWTRGAVDEALGAYEASRVEAAATVQRTARTWGDIWHVDRGVGQLLRDEAFRRRDVHDYHLVDWLYGPVVEDTTPEPINAEGPHPADTHAQTAPAGQPVSVA